MELSLQDPVPSEPPLPGDPEGLQTSVDLPAGAQFFRLSIGGGPPGNEWTLDCIRQLNDETRLEELATATSEQALAMDAFYRNVPEEYREPNRLTFYVGTWAANPELTFSGANGVSGPAQDFGIDDASTMYLRFQRTF